MRIEEIVNRFQNVKIIREKQIQCSCPVHKDSKPSLTITEEDGKILMYCHAGCDTKDILEAVGLKESDLFNNQVQEKPKVVKEYFYQDENGNTLYKVMRFEPKSFVQAKYENGNWIYKMTGVRYVLYNLPNVVKSNEIYFVEGEKDADNLNSLGLTATTSVGGALGFNKHKSEYVDFLKDKVVYIIPDNDDAGKNYATTILKSLKNYSRNVKILNLSSIIPNLKNKADISDVLSMYGKDKTLKIIDELKKTINFFNYSGEHITKKFLEEILKSLNIKVRYNEITKNTEVIGLPNEYPEDSGIDILPAFISELCLENKIKYKEKDIRNELLLISQSNIYNPIKDMLINTEWDKKDRFNKLYEILGITDDELSKILVKKWCYQTVMIVFNTKKNIFGTEGVLTLQGPQDAR